MSKTIIFTDSHINDPYLDELKDGFDEIMSYDADNIIHLGDYYDSNRPSPRSIMFGTEMAKKLVDKYKNVTILAGNGRHNWLNGGSVIDYLKVLGVEIVGMDLEREIDGKKCFFAHAMTNESYKEYGSHEYTVKELRKYDIALLGHQHLLQELTPTIHHVGSMFWQHFNEVADKYKRIAIIEDGELSFIPLLSPDRMIDVTDIKELPKIDPKTKVRLLIPDFHTFKNIVKQLPEWKEKFVEFKYELRYDKVSKNTQKVIKSDSISQLSIIEEIKKIDDPEVRQILQELFSGDK